MNQAGIGIGYLRFNGERLRIHQWAKRIGLPTDEFQLLLYQMPVDLAMKEAARIVEARKQAAK